MHFLFVCYLFDKDMAKQAKIYPKGRFILRPLKQQSGMTNAVYMYYFWQRKQLRKAMDLYVDEKDWNENAEHGTGGFRASYGSDYLEKNAFLQSVLQETDKKILEYIQKNGSITPDVIASMMNCNGTMLRKDIFINLSTLFLVFVIFPIVSVLKKWHKCHIFNIIALACQYKPLPLQ